jgi:hypothetical protein
MKHYSDCKVNGYGVGDKIIYAPESECDCGGYATILYAGTKRKPTPPEELLAECKRLNGVRVKKGGRNKECDFFIRIINKEDKIVGLIRCPNVSGYLKLVDYLNLNLGE